MSETFYDTKMRGPLSESRKGARWTDEEKVELQDCFSKGYGLWACAVRLNRCAVGTLEQLAKLGLVQKQAPFYRDATVTEKGKELIGQKNKDEEMTSRIYSSLSSIVMSDMSNLEMRLLAHYDTSKLTTHSVNYPSTLGGSLYYQLATTDTATYKPTQEPIMIDKTIPFQQVSYVYGNIAETCSDADLIAALKRVSSNIKDLQDVAVLGADKYAASRIKSLESQKEQLLALLEKR
jgi:hypothetical protein